MEIVRLAWSRYTLTAVLITTTLKAIVACSATGVLPVADKSHISNTIIVTITAVLITRVASTAGGSYIDGRSLWIAKLDARGVGISDNVHVGHKVRIRVIEAIVTSAVLRAFEFSIDIVRLVLRTRDGWAFAATLFTTRVPAASADDVSWHRTTVTKLKTGAASAA